MAEFFVSGDHASGELIFILADNAFAGGLVPAPGERSIFICAGESNRGPGDSERAWLGISNHAPEDYNKTIALLQSSTVLRGPVRYGSRLYQCPNPKNPKETWRVRFVPEAVLLSRLEAEVPKAQCSRIPINVTGVRVDGTGAAIDFSIGGIGVSFGLPFMSRGGNNGGGNRYSGSNGGSGRPSAPSPGSPTHVPPGRRVPSGQLIPSGPLGPGFRQIRPRWP